MTRASSSAMPLWSVMDQRARIVLADLLKADIPASPASMHSIGTISVYTSARLPHCANGFGRIIVVVALS